MAVTHLITGFGLDRRVFDGLELPPEQFRCANLIPVEAGESLPRYASRLAEAIRFEPGDAIGGISLGGMLALEIARQRGAARIVLLASCTHPRFIRPVFRAAGRLAPWTPKFLLHLLFANIHGVLRLLGMHTELNAKFLRGVMGDFPPALLQQLPRMMMDWEGCEPVAPCRALHSESDWLIRPPFQLPNVVLLPGPSHLITVSHPGATRNFLLSQVLLEE